MDERIGRYEGDTRILPKKTLSGAPVSLPVMNTISLGRGLFAVLDYFPPRFFDVEAEANKLRTGASVPVQPTFGERVFEDPAVRDVGALMNDDASKGRK